MSLHLGFSCSQHDPAIAVVNADGAVVFAEANERPLKCKRGWHSPPDAFGAIEAVIDEYVGNEDFVANLTWSGAALRSSRLLTGLADLSIAAFSRLEPLGRESNLWRALMFRHALYRAPSSAEHVLLNLHYRHAERHGLRSRLRRQNWNHHLCHAAAACWSSTFDDALCVIMDGMGEGASTAIFRFQNGMLTRLDRPQPANLASLGVLYSQLCFAAGFDPMAGEEWKLMGLAAYGRVDEVLRARLRAAIRVTRNGLSITSAYADVLDDVMRGRIHPPRENADLAATAQVVFEDILFEFLSFAHKNWGGKNLVFTGGCALNSSANGKILRATPFGALHVPMAPGDEGNAVGAALLSWQAANPGCVVPRFDTPYLGSRSSEETVARFSLQGMSPHLVAESDEQLTHFVAAELAGGSVIGWMQGRAEFGHRALGNRSILADPRPANIADRLNATVKFREEFRPFAPSILHEAGPDFFEDYAYAPYMERTLKWRPDRAPPGVRHADGSGRVHSVTREANPLFHDLIEAFRRKTGLPILLNTSFNVMGRPMVHDVEDAIGVFYTSGLDMLVLGRAVYRKPKREAR